MMERMGIENGSGILCYTAVTHSPGSWSLGEQVALRFFHSSSPSPPVLVPSKHGRPLPPWSRDIPFSHVPWDALKSRNSH